MKDYGMQTLTAVSDLGSKQVARVLEAPVCRQSVGQLGAILDVADHVVDTVLPENGNDFFKWRTNRSIFVTESLKYIKIIFSWGKRQFLIFTRWRKTEYTDFQQT